MKIITANNGNKFKFSNNSWKLIKKSTTELDYPETTARLHGLDVEVKWVGSYHPATMIDLAEYPKAEIIGAEITNRDEFYASIYSDELESGIADNISIHYDQFGIQPNYIEFLLDGVKYVLKTPTLDATDAEPVNISIVDELGFLAEFPWNEEVQEQMLELWR